MVDPVVGETVPPAKVWKFRSAVPVNETPFRNRVFADGIKLGGAHTEAGWALIQRLQSLQKCDIRATHTGEMALWDGGGGTLMGLAATKRH